MFSASEEPKKDLIELKKEPEMKEKSSTKEFFSHDPKTTLHVSICPLDSGGCHELSKTMAVLDNKDYKYIGFEITHEEEGFTSKILKDTTASQDIFNTVVLTGCAFSASKFVIESLKEKYTFSKTPNIQIVVPPHFEAKTQVISVLKNQLDLNHPYTVVTTGIKIDQSDSIGLPPPIPKLSSESKYILPTNCFGLMYTRDLLVNEKFPPEILQPKKALEYMIKCFSQIKSIARETLSTDSTSSVLVIASKNYEKQVIDLAAKLVGIEVTYVDRLPAQDYTSAIKQIAEKGGIIGQNGVQTLFQALSLGARTFTYSNLSRNVSFYEELSKSVPEELQATAKVILGLSQDISLLKEEEQIKAVHQILRSLIEKSVLKFEAGKAAGKESLLTESGSSSKEMKQEVSEKPIKSAAGEACNDTTIVSKIKSSTVTIPTSSGSTPLQAAGLFQKKNLAQPQENHSPETRIVLKTSV